MKRKQLVVSLCMFSFLVRAESGWALGSVGVRVTGKNKVVIKNGRSHHGSPGGYGINLYGSDRNTVSENRIEANQSQGLWLIGSWDNLIYRNNFVRNSTNAVDETGANQWYHPQRREGNFWSDHAAAEIPLGRIQ